MAPFLMETLKIRLSFALGRDADFRLECMWVSLQRRFNRTASLGLVLQIVVTVFAVAIHAKLSVSEAFAVEF